MKSNLYKAILALSMTATLALIFTASRINVLAQTASAPIASLVNDTSSETMMEGVNLQRTGVYRTKGVPQFNGLLWKSTRLFEINYAAASLTAFDGSGLSVDIGFSEPILANGLIYFQLCVSLKQNYILALDANSGRGVWKALLRDSLSSPAIAGDSLYVLATDNNLYALDLRTGAEKWKYSAKDKWNTSSSPMIANGVVYFNSLSGNLYAVDILTKQAKWVFKAKGLLTSPAYDDDTIYVGSEKGVLYAVDAQTGQEKWDFKAKGWLGTPIIADGMTYFRTEDGNLYAIDVKTGRQRWMTPVGGKVQPVFPLSSVKIGTSLAFYDGTIFFAGWENKSNYLFAIDAETGQQKWKFKVAGPCRSPVIADGIIYVGSLGNLYAVDARSGLQKWVLESKSEYHGKQVKNVVSSPFVANATAYFVTDEGFFYAVR